MVAGKENQLPIYFTGDILNPEILTDIKKIIFCAVFSAFILIPMSAVESSGINWHWHWHWHWHWRLDLVPE